MSGVDWPVRARVWDAAMAAVRACLRGGGMVEVTTPVRVECVALEPWIEPIAAGSQLLATSPELSMKQLLARGAGSMFQIAHVFRAAERGAQHREEFHLIEWYRAAQGPDSEAVETGPVMADVEAIVAAVFEAVHELGLGPGAAGLEWEVVEIVPLMAETLGVELAGDEDALALAHVLDGVRDAAGLGLAGDAWPTDDAELADLLAWTELFSLWSDLHLDPWLAARGHLGVHVVGFPRALAALSEHEADGRRAARFESHVRGIELANGYRELREPDEQRRRFDRVARMRAHYGLAPLPVPEAFLAELAQLPPCAGAALGLDRLVALACGVEELADICLDPRIDHPD